MGHDCVTRETTPGIRAFEMTTEMKNWTETPTTRPEWITKFQGEIDEFATVEIIWFIFCCMGLWAGSKGVRVLCLIEAGCWL